MRPEVTQQQVHQELEVVVVILVAWRAAEQTERYIYTQESTIHTFLEPSTSYWYTFFLLD